MSDPLTIDDRFQQTLPLAGNEEIVDAAPVPSSGIHNDGFHGPADGSAARQEPDEIDREEGEPKRGIVRSFLSFIGWSLRGSFCIVALIVLLAALTAIPVVQLVAFGYLLSVAGGLAAGTRFRDCLPHLREAGQIGMAALAIILAALPTQLLSHWESVATLINPDSNQAAAMRVLAITCSALATIYLLWAWIRGGRLKHYLWPQPKRFLREGWRWTTWNTAADRLWDFTVSLQLPRYFWLGLRGAVGTLIWLIPAMIIVAAFRNGETGLAGLVGFVSLVFLGIGMLYLADAAGPLCCREPILGVIRSPHHSPQFSLCTLGVAGSDDHRVGLDTHSLVLVEDRSDAARSDVAAMPRLHCIHSASPNRDGTSSSPGAMPR